MKKRYIKRIIRRILLFIIAIVSLSLITSLVVERRLKAQKDEAKTVTDIHGDQVTVPHPRQHQGPTSRRPRPPVQQREPYRIWPYEFAEDFNMDLAELAAAGIDFQLPTPRGAKRDWNDYAAMEADRLRVGLGEHGVASYLQFDEAQKEVERNISMLNGFNAMLSDAISVNRSVPDVRKEACRSKEYLSKLPTISVVIPFHEEHFSVLIRTLCSIVNRTPPVLLHEIIIVDDGSERANLKKPLDDYITKHFFNLVKIVRQPERIGLIGARLAGARQAVGDVLIFFDSHIECSYNWLPPLLEPIAINKRIATCPIVDSIDHATFAYSGGYQVGSRGAFDWNMLYKQLPLRPEDRMEETVPTRNPIMMGGLFAINREFFWELGGYDEELDIWGGEQFELSFKIWMCGGMLLDVPCSRVAHIFRGPWTSRPSNRNYNFLARNLKRVAEAWMDEYKEYFYMRRPDTYAAIDAGNISKSMAIRERLKCKSFKWYLEIVVPDLLIAFPPIEPPDYANGAIQNAAHPIYCLDTLGGGAQMAVGLYPCADNKTHPQPTQHWHLSYARDLRNSGREICLDAPDSSVDAKILMWQCHSQGGNQFWYYDLQMQWLVHGIHGQYCIEAIEDIESKAMRVQLNRCDAANERMKWQFGYVNETALRTFFTGLE